MNLTLPEASSNAHETDALLAGLLLISLAVLGLVFGLMFVYVVKYRRSQTFSRGEVGQKSWIVEISWTSATLVAFFGLFLWGANLYVRLFQAPADALKIYVVGKQWMWKIEHQGGQKEIDALHVPVNRDIQLVMTSEDVIHDFSVPAFRIKHDVLPGRYEQLWFRATLPGTYALYCTQFCGTDHSAMGGFVTVLSGADYARWLDHAGAGAADGLAAEGRALFTRHGCSGCHQAAAFSATGGTVTGGAVHAPPLDGVFGAPVPLSDGTVVVADDAYIRDSILYPARQIVAGYQPVMPSFLGQIDESDLIRIVAYIKSLPARQK